MSGALYCGVDIGASAAKLVLIDESSAVLARVVESSGVDYAGIAQSCLERALGQLGRHADEIVWCVATGYGRNNVEFAKSRATEILCHGKACHHLVPGAITVVDIGGQDNKIIRLDEQGRQLEFKMNRKCAAGTGAFLEEIALRLRVPLEQLDALAQSSTQPVRLGSFCTVFAKTEILSHLRQGVALPDVIAGAFESVASRVLEMDALPGQVVVTGGVVAHNPVLEKLLSRTLGRSVIVPPYPQFTGALGAALCALESSRKTL
ncbi:MAG: acyl-CoA dehydratase activase [Myxococcota bacterium]|nr:acyl-CoA dehydratase activase [Myxococcota bacterium]